MKRKVKILKKLFLTLFLFNSVIFIVFFNQYFYYNNSFNKNPIQIYNENENYLRSSFTLTFTENFQTQTYRNESITNSTGWGKDYLSLVHQEVINLSNYDYNLDQINSIRSQGNLLFLADNSFGLKVLNISNPMNPTLISQYGDTYNNTLDIAFQGKFAYIADGIDGMEIIDLSNPVSLQKVGNWSNGYNVTNILISDSLAFLSIQDFGIEILNISNPQSPIKVSNWTNNRNPSNVVVKGNKLFVASENYKLEILDISNLNEIITISELPITNIPYEILVRNDYLYLANGIEGLKVIDITDISNPSLVSTPTQDGSITNILIEENYIFLANNTYLSIVDRLNPFNQELTYHWDINEKITSIEIYGEYIYLGCEFRGLQILKFSEFITPKQIYKFSPNINAHNVILDYDRAYLCAIEDGGYDGGLFIFNISNPYDPQALGNFSKPGFSFYDVEIKDEICFAAVYDNGLISLNISDPANINILDSISGYLLNYSQKVEVVDDIAFVANGFIGLDIYNISDPLNFQHITNYPGDLSSVGVYTDIKIRNKCAFIAKGYKGLEIFNISNLNNIQSIANYTDSYNNSQALEFWGNYLLVADRFDGLEIIDISDINNPQKVSQYTDTYNRATKVKVINNLAIISDRTDGIEIINLSNPLNPIEVASYSDNYNNSWGCVATSRFLYIADGYDGFQIAQYKEHLFNQYEKRAIAQSLEIDKTIATITNATMIINGEVPDNTSIQSLLSNDNGNNWDSVSNNSLHIFGTIGSELIWKVILTTSDDLETPKIFDIMINYSAINTPPIILNPSELQNLAIWNQAEDFGFFEFDLAGYKDDNEFIAEYLYWSVINLDTSLVSVVQDNLNKDLFRFYSIDNVYGNDEFDLMLEDEGGAHVSLNITLNIYNINDAPTFIESNIIIQQEKDFIQIEYEAEDIDNLPSELNYYIYYGTDNDWHLIIENYKDTTYTWNTTHIQEGNYYIRIDVSDGLANDTWISSEIYSVKRKSESPLIYIIIISSCVVAGVISGVVIYTVKRRKSKALHLIDKVVDKIQDDKSEK